MDTTYMDLADLTGSLSDLPEELKLALATNLLGQYMGAPHPNDAFLIIRTQDADLARAHAYHHLIAQKVPRRAAFQGLLSSLTFRPGVDDKLGWGQAGRKAVRKTLSRTAGAFGHTIN
jgi:hypothetical protein